PLDPFLMFVETRSLRSVEHQSGQLRCSVAKLVKQNLILRGEVPAKCRAAIRDRVKHAPLALENDRRRKSLRFRIVRSGDRMQRECAVSDFRHRAQIRNLLTFRASREIESEVALADSVGAQLSSYCAGKVTFRSIECGQTVERLGDIGVLRSQRVLPDLQRSLMKRLGLGKVAPFLIQNSEIVERISNLGMLWTQGLFKDLQLASMELFSFDKITLASVDHREVAASESHLRVL